MLTRVHIPYTNTRAHHTSDSIICLKRLKLCWVQRLESLASKSHPSRRELGIALGNPYASYWISHNPQKLQDLWKVTVTRWQYSPSIYSMYPYRIENSISCPSRTSAQKKVPFFVTHQLPPSHSSLITIRQWRANTDIAFTVCHWVLRMTQETGSVSASRLQKGNRGPGNLGNLSSVTQFISDKTRIQSWAVWLQSLCLNSLPVVHYLPLRYMTPDSEETIMFFL